MRGVFQRVVVFALAFAVTAAVFLFWGKLGYAFRTAMVVVYAEPKPAAQPATTPGEVSVMIIPSPVHKQVCGKDKQHPCPPFP
jgi:hypothetical protein